MAVSGKRTDTDKGGCDSELGNVCEPCQGDTITTQACGYCKDCGEYMCDTCFRHHLRGKLCRHHVLIDVDMANLPVHGGKESERKCNKHNGETTKFYCRKHDVVGCGDCMVLEHNVCKLEYIKDASTNFHENKAFKALVTKIEILMFKNKEIKDNCHEHEQNNMFMLEKLLEDIRKFRADINRYLDAVEADVISEAKRIMADNDKLLTELAQDCKELSFKIENVKQRLNTELYEDNVLFINTVEWKPRVTELEQKIALAHSETIKRFEFVCDQQLRDFVTSLKQLGSLAISQTVSSHQTKQATEGRDVKTQKPASESEGSNDSSRLPLVDAQSRTWSVSAKSEPYGTGQSAAYQQPYNHYNYSYYYPPSLIPGAGFQYPYCHMPQVTNAAHADTPANAQYQEIKYGSHVQYGTNKMYDDLTAQTGGDFKSPYGTSYTQSNANISSSGTWGSGSSDILIPGYGGKTHTQIGSGQNSSLQNSLSVSGPYGVSQASTVSQNAMLQERQNPRKSKLPPQSKIPASAVVMPGNIMTTLDVQFGGNLEFGDSPAFSFGGNESVTSAFSANSRSTPTINDHVGATVGQVQVSNLSKTSEALISTGLEQNSPRSSSLYQQSPYTTPTKQNPANSSNTSMDLTGFSQDKLEIALYDSNNDMDKAIHELLEDGTDESELRKSGKKKKKKQKQSKALPFENHVVCKPDRRYHKERNDRDNDRNIEEKENGEKGYRESYASFCQRPQLYDTGLQGCQEVDAELTGRGTDQNEMTMMVRRMITRIGDLIVGLEHDVVGVEDHTVLPVRI